MVVEVLTSLRDWEHAAQRMQHAAHNEELLQEFENLYLNDDVPEVSSGDNWAFFNYEVLKA